MLYTTKETERANEHMQSSLTVTEIRPIKMKTITNCQFTHMSIALLKTPREGKNARR